ncbi:MAG: hypothetical protein ABIP42_15005 [Planctomycetota bacterium]
MRTPQLWIGLALIAVIWPLNWGLDGVRTHLLFFPLWLGYALVVDGWCARRTGTSALTRSPRGFALQFALSGPAWWLFELINARLGNWEYVGRERFSDVEYALLCSASFSTVLPSVLGTAELLLSTRWVQRRARGPRLAPSRVLNLSFALLGASMLTAMLVWPKIFYPFCWTSLVFLLEPLAQRLGRRSFQDDLTHGDWRPWWALWTAGLVCGFFWEMWNWHSDPKWIYHVPGVAFWKVFEMPLLGYLGYLPFAMELYLFANLCLPNWARPKLSPLDHRVAPIPVR